MMTFRQFLAQVEEGLMLPDRPPVPGKPRLNTTPVPRSWQKGKAGAGTKPRLRPKMGTPGVAFGRGLP